MLIISSIVVAQQTTVLDPSQVSNTGNLVNNSTSPTDTTSTWQNVGSWNQGLPCWGPGGPVYCGPQPYFNNGSFNFSYGMTDVYQVVNIAKALPNSGTGLRVNGFNFGFTAKNGNGWDNGQQDYLEAYVKFYGSDGKIAQSYNYGNYTNQKYDWTTFNFSETFNTPYASKDLNSVQYGFVGMDTNYWAGPYGPEIYNISFSLKYSVDPCATNVLYSPTCPGYLDALAKLAPSSTTESADTTNTTTTPTTTVTTTITADPTSPTVTVTSTPIAPSSSSTTSTTNSSSTTSTASTTPTSTPAKEGSSQNTSTSVGLSVIAKNQQREQSIANQAVQNATTTAANAAQQSQQEAMSVAAQAASNSTTSAATTNTSMSSGTGIRMSGTSSTGLTLPGLSPDILPNAQSQQMMSNNSFISNQDTRQSFNPIITNNPSSLLSYTENMTYNQSDFLTNRTNPLNEVIEAKQTVPQTNSVQPIGSSVNRNVGDNDVAGGVSIARMAVAPTGYGDYLNFTLRDAAFYAPKEVYRNQRNVDNARALRQLTNDSKHQEMVEQQYRR